MGASVGCDKDMLCPGCGSMEGLLPCFTVDADNSTSSGSSQRGQDRNGKPRKRVDPTRIEDLIYRLFELHDLNGDGLLDEGELIELNVVIAILHQGSDANKENVRQKYHKVFREKLDPSGKPVPYKVFRAYAVEVLEGLDRDLRAQEMILEQFVAEAQSGRDVLPGIMSDAASPKEWQSSDAYAGVTPPPPPPPPGQLPRALSSTSTPGADEARGLVFGSGQTVWEGASCFPGAADCSANSWSRANGQSKEHGYPQPHPMWMACAGVPTQAAYATPARSVVPQAVYNNRSSA